VLRALTATQVLLDEQVQRVIRQVDQAHYRTKSKVRKLMERFTRPLR